MINHKTTPTLPYYTVFVNAKSSGISLLFRLLYTQEVMTCHHLLGMPNDSENRSAPPLFKIYMPPCPS
jgi:hypothetical protein